MRIELMEWSISEIGQWIVYGLFGWALLIFLIATVYAINMSDDRATRNVTATSAYVCATLLMAIGIQLLIRP